MTCARVVTIIFLIYIFLGNLLEIGYTIYEMVSFMQSPSQYYITCLIPNKINQKGEQVCDQFGMLTSQYRKQLYNNVSDDRQPPVDYNVNYSYPNSTCLVENGEIAQLFQKAFINNKIKIAAIVFQSFALFILIVVATIEYSVFLPKFCIVKCLINIQKKVPNYFIILLIDLIITPFLCIVTFKFTYQCIQSNFMTRVIRNVGFWFIFPYITIVLGPISFCYGINGIKGMNNACACLCVFSVLGFLGVIVIGQISLILSQPLPIIIPLIVKQVIQVLLLLVKPLKKQAHLIHEQYQKCCEMKSKKTVMKTIKQQNMASKNNENKFPQLAINKYAQPKQLKGSENSNNISSGQLLQ